LIWHNDDLIEQAVEEKLKVLPNGQGAALHAAMYLQVKDCHVTRIEEYLDSARRSSIRAATEALSAG
jgi:hypothetical protein